MSGPNFAKLTELAARNTAAEAAEEEAAAGGRRARKSVNYALPKLNTCVAESLMASLFGQIGD